MQDPHRCFVKCAEPKTNSNDWKALAKVSRNNEKENINRNAGVK